MRGMEHRKEKRIQEGWKGEINQVRNIINCSLDPPPPQCAHRLLVERGGWISPFPLDISCGLSSSILGWGRYLDQGSSADMDEAPDARERSFYKSKGDQQDKQNGC